MTRMREVTLEELKGADAFRISATLTRLLKQLERDTGLEGVAEQYEKEAHSSDYAHLCRVSEDYALKYLRETLQAKEGDLTILHEEELLWHDE